MFGGLFALLRVLARFVDPPAPALLSAPLTSASPMVASPAITMLAFSSPQTGVPALIMAWDLTTTGTGRIQSKLFPEEPLPPPNLPPTGTELNGIGQCYSANRLPSLDAP